MLDISCINGSHSINVLSDFTNCFLLFCYRYFSNFEDFWETEVFHFLCIDVLTLLITYYIVTVIKYNYIEFLD